MKAARRGRLLAIVLLIFALAPAFAAEKILIGRQLTDPQTPEAAAAAADLMEQVASLANRLFAASIQVTPDAAGGKEDYTLSLILSLNKDNPSAVLRLARAAHEDTSVTYPYLGVLTPEVPSILANGVFLLWNNLRGTLGALTQEPPVFADELPAELLAANSTPMSIAVKPEGTMVAGLAVSCVELDHSFRLVARIGANLYDAGLYAYAYGVSATPGGTVFLKPGMGKDVYRIPPGTREPQRMGLGQELTYASLIALADGSLFLLDSFNKHALRIQGRKRTEFKIFSTQWSYITTAAAAPDGSLWFYDQLMKGIRIYTLEGTPVDSLLPLVDLANPLTPTSMSIGPDGSFVLLSYGQLAKFRRDGRLVWRIGSFEGSDQPALPANGSVAVDWTRGLIYIADMTGRRIVKLIDRAYCREKGIRNDLEEKVVALRLKRADDELAFFTAAAAVYETAGSTLMARAYWQRVEDEDPGNPTAAARLLAMQVDDLKQAARDLDAKARATLASIGIESARPISVQAIQKYELIMSKAPGDEETRKAMTELRKLFSDTDQGPGQKKSITITDLRLANLFPSLMQWYATHSAGSVTVKNSLAGPVEKVRASLFIPEFMTVRMETKPAATLPAGQSVTFDLAPAFSQKVLELQEDMAVPAEIVITYLADSAEQTVSRTASATIYRNTALTWDDTRKISSYITPNEETVSGFAARVLAAAAGRERISLSRKIFQAMRLCDALGTYGITYVQDPESPFSRALGKAEIVDTVRFPRMTLYNRTGDCDDTTALLSSLLESVGIPTAILTTPGHIFMAFDSGEPVENAHYLSSESLEVVSRGGHAWIPVETTILSQGFMAAWASASSLVRKHAPSGSFEFIPLSDMRDSYPALPLPPSSITVAEPAKAGVDRAYAASVTGFTASLYSDRLKAWEGRLAALSGRQAVKLRVQEGVLHAIFGRMTEAEGAFRAAIAEDPGLVSPYVNLANIRLLSNDGSGALQVVKQGLAKNANSALLNLLAARVYADRNDAANAAAHFAKAISAAPELAARYPELAEIGQPRTASTGGSGGTGPQRAAQAGEKPPVIWGTDQ